MVCRLTMCYHFAKCAATCAAVPPQHEAPVDLRPGTDADADTLAAYCQDRLAAYTYPRQVEILPDLSKTASGKILRREPRSRAHDQ
ncbi:AMP-binding enzyme [Streptomyces sp. YKOK-I1]